VNRTACIRGLVSVAVLSGAATSLAEPPARGQKLTSASDSNTKTVVTGPSAAVRAAAKPWWTTGLHATATGPIPRDDSGRPMLTLTTVNRHESMTVPALTDDGGFATVDLDRLTHLLRAGSDDEHPIDPRTIDLVYRIERHFNVPEIRVVSAYRIPRPGSHSNHSRGRAIDLIVPGTPDEDVARFARGFGFVGVGIYPVSQFVHVDIRPRSYFWVDLSGPRMKNHELQILGDLATKNDAAAAARGQAPIEPFGIGPDVDAMLATRGTARPPGVVADDDEDEEN